MADSKKVVIDGVEYVPDHSGLLANSTTNPVADLAEAPVEVASTEVAAPHNEGVTTNEVKAETPVEAPVAPEAPAEAPVEEPAKVEDVAPTE